MCSSIGDTLDDFTPLSTHCRLLNKRKLRDHARLMRTHSFDHMTLINVQLQTYDYDKKQQGMILSSFFWGYLVAQLPVSHMAHHFGAKILLTIASIMCAILTLITPWAASIDWKLLVASRVLQGLFQGFYYPCVHTLLAKWAHPRERSVLSTAAYSGTQAGSVVMLAISGLLASSTMGWPSIFYVSGGGTLVWTAVWILFGSSSPADCARITIEERQFIESMPGSTQRKLNAPWLSIIRSTPVIALIIVHSTQCWGFWTLLTETPSFLVQVFRFDIKTVNLFLKKNLPFWSHANTIIQNAFRSLPLAECTVIRFTLFSNVGN